MTREQAREAAQVMLGFADGKEVQYRSPYSDVWIDVEETDTLPWDWTLFIYRLKPAPVLRPWTADEVPLGAFIRPKEGSWRSLILAVDSDERINVNCGGFPLGFALENHEHSLDGGKTWLPCGVVEDVK